MFKRVFTVFGALLAALACFSSAADAATPPDCHPSDPQVRFSESTVTELDSPLRDGDRLVIGASVGLKGSILACDLSEVTVFVHLPDSRGVPGPGLPVSTPIELPGDTLPADLKSTIPFMVDLDPDVFKATIGLSWTAVVKGISPEMKLAGEAVSRDFWVSRPAATVKVTPDVLSGESPLTVNYEYELTNTSVFGDFNLYPPLLYSRDRLNPYSVLSDPNCGPLNYVSPLAAEPGVGSPLDQETLMPGETWRFRCSATYHLPGTYTSEPVVDAINFIDDREWPVVASEGANVTVNGVDLVISKTHQKDFIAGNSGEYTIRVTNRGNRRTEGEITMVDHLPQGLRAIGIYGAGWKCVLETLTCSRPDRIGSGISLQDITVQVMTTSNPPSHVVNTATVSGGGETEAATKNNVASDPTRIRIPSQPDPVAKSSLRLIKVQPRADASTIVTLSVMGSGRLNFKGASKRKLIRKASKRVPATGSYSIRLKSTAKLRRELKRRKKTLRTRVKVEFKSKSGATRSMVRSIPFRFKTR